jgi:hypothetical protein
LNTITARYGLMVNAKVRVADVLPIEGSGISDDLYKYSLMAHFDFLLTNEEHIPQFAVEFDGPTHELRRSKAWDEKKDALCRRFAFPLLRIKINYLPNIYNELSLLKWIIDVYYLQEAFFAAQEKGQIPYDEPFTHFSSGEPVAMVTRGVFLIGFPAMLICHFENFTVWARSLSPARPVSLGKMHRETSEVSNI